MDRRHAINYFSQLRMYSYADLLLLFAAVRTGLPHAALASLLWFGFIVHLEWRHRDHGRTSWPWYAWCVPWLVAIVLWAQPQVWLFLILASTYALKKRFPAIAAVSPLLNGGLKTALVVGAPGAGHAVIALVFTLTAARNLLGDIRDAGKDAAEGVRTVPVLLGYCGRNAFVYPAGLACTSVAWTVLGHLSPWYLVAALAVEAATYRLTPR
jgi:4-hydroxybenzoate polyprenyltransferase